MRYDVFNAFRGYVQHDVAWSEIASTVTEEEEVEIKDLKVGEKWERTSSKFVAVMWVRRVK